MKIWTLTINDDNGMPEPQVYFTAAAADVPARAWVADKWGKWSDDPMPEDWRDAFETLRDTVGFMDSISVAEHDISDHPAIAAALQTLDEAEAIALHAKTEERSLTPGELIDVYDAIADSSGILRGNITHDSFGISPNLQDHIETVTDAYRKVAMDQATDDLEIDPDAYVAVSEDGDGAFVAAWLWVPESDAAKHMPPLPQETMQ